MSERGGIWREDHCLWPRARLARDPLSRAIGLLGRRGLADDEALWLRPCSAVHMWGMRIAIDIVWLDGTGRILGLRAGLRPWQYAWPRVRGVRDTIELAAGAIERWQLLSGQRLEWR
ncbi:MAG: DUF192 domain-containing protein, partial [Acidithiobacillus sp.]|nr:DUF192 domain-containing protein [Acidithiobacillus sp.]